MGLFLGEHGGGSKSAAVAAPPNHELAPECRAALRMAGEGLGMAVSGLGQAQSAAAATNDPANTPSPSLGVINATSGRVQGLLQQYNAAQATCQSLSAAQANGSTSSPTGESTKR